MEDSATAGRQEYDLASRKSEESALRRYQASHWLECLVGKLGLSDQPSEKEFISCLRNGLVLCKLMNKIQPGSVPKVVINQSASNLHPWDSQPLPAYQYFENVRNFLAAIEALKLPIFEASIFERDTVQDGSSAKVVDCILALKAYHEWQQTTGEENGTHKPPRNPYVVHFTGRNNPAPSVSLKPSDGGFRQPDMPEGINEEKQKSTTDNQNIQEMIVKAVSQHLVDLKENLDKETLNSFLNGKMDVDFLGKILSTCLEEESQKKSLENCKYWNILDFQEKEVLNLKSLLSSTKKDFQAMQSRMNNDFVQLGNLVKAMGYASRNYRKVVEVNRGLHNTVQRPRLLPEKTPPRTRRLSIGNSSNAREERTSFSYGNRSKTPPPTLPPIQPRLRRLSLGGGGGSMTGYKEPVQTDVIRPKMVQLTKTPEPAITGSSSSVTHAKESHIRKSLRSIGKFINGSDRRNQEKINEAKSPVSFSSKSTRRQSLSGLLPSISLRRSSIGGAEENRSSKTPPPDLRGSDKAVDLKSFLVIKYML